MSKAWSSKLFHFYTEDHLKKHLKPLEGSDIAASPYLKMRKETPKEPKDCLEVKQRRFNEDGVYSKVTKNGGKPMDV